MYLDTLDIFYELFVMYLVLVIRLNKITNVCNIIIIIFAELKLVYLNMYIYIYLMQTGEKFIYYFVFFLFLFSLFKYYYVLYKFIFVIFI